MPTYRVGDMVDVIWIGFNGSELLPDTVLSYDAEKNEYLCSMTYKGDTMQLTFEAFRILPHREFHMLGDE